MRGLFRDVKSATMTIFPQTQNRPRNCSQKANQQTPMHTHTHIHPHAHTHTHAHFEKETFPASIMAWRKRHYKLNNSITTGSSISKM